MPFPSVRRSGRVCVAGALLAITACSSHRSPSYGRPYGQAYQGGSGYQGRQGYPTTASNGPRPVAAYDRPVDAMALNAPSVQSQACAPTEVAPGVWVGFDCAFQAISRALPMKSTRSSFVGGTVPPTVDLRSLGLDGPIKNQGAVGACTAFSLSTAMDIAVRKMGRPDVVAPLHVWSEYAIPNMGLAGDQVVDEAITTEDKWPYDPAKACKLMRIPVDSCGKAYGVVPGSGLVDARLQSEKHAADAAGRFKIQSVEQFDKPLRSDQLAAVLAGGDPIWIALSVNPKAWKSSSLKGAVIPDYDTSDSSGHAVVLVGYRAGGSGRQFLVHNSWGTKWGDGGYGWLNDSMIAKHGRAAYKVRVTDTSGASPFPSLPTPGGNTPSSGGCPQGQAKDVVLGTCSPACASGSAPAAGVCLPPVPGFPAPQPGGNASCPQGQASDPMTGKCSALCPTGTPPIGGLCLPFPGR